MSETAPLTPRDRLLADAKSVPSLLAQAQAFDRPLYGFLTGSQAKNVWYGPAVSVVAWGAAHFGLGWDADTCSAIAGVLLVGITAAVHRFAPTLESTPTK